MFLPCVLPSLSHFIFCDMSSWVVCSYFPSGPSSTTATSPFLFLPFDFLYLPLNQERTVIQIHKGKLRGRADSNLRQQVGPAFVFSKDIYLDLLSAITQEGTKVVHSVNL